MPGFTPAADPLAVQAPEVEADARAVRGSLLFHLALAEALAGDALAGRPPPETVGGWALDVGADGYEAAAVGLGEAPDVRARVTFAADGAPIVEAGRGAAASMRQAALARVREAAAGYGGALGGRWLALPVPPPLDMPLPSEIDAYLVRTHHRARDLVAGPHWRLTISTSDGEVRGAALACGQDLTVADAAMRASERLVLVHAEDRTPSELHVFLSLRHGLNLHVHTPRSGLRWRVEGERIVRLA